MRSLTFLSCLPVLERSPDINSKFRDPLCGCKASACAAAGEGQHCQPWAAGVRGAGAPVCHPRSPLHAVLPFHSSLNGPFQVPPQFLHLLVPLLEQWLSPFLIHGLSQVLSKEAPACELLFLVI